MGTRHVYVSESNTSQIICNSCAKKFLQTKAEATAENIKTYIRANAPAFERYSDKIISEVIRMQAA